MKTKIIGQYKTFGARGGDRSFRIEGFEDGSIKIYASGAKPLIVPRELARFMFSRDNVKTVRNFMEKQGKAATRVRPSRKAIATREYHEYVDAQSNVFDVTTAADAPARLVDAVVPTSGVAVVVTEYGTRFTPASEMKATDDRDEVHASA